MAPYRGVLFSDVLSTRIPAEIEEDQEAFLGRQPKHFVAGTIAFNRARGEHLLDPMENIVQNLLSEGYQVNEITKKLGMSKEELYRLSNVSKEEFLRLMAKDNRYSDAQKI